MDTLVRGTLLRSTEAFTTASGIEFVGEVQFTVADGSVFDLSIRSYRLLKKTEEIKYLPTHIGDSYCLINVDLADCELYSNVRYPFAVIQGIDFSGLFNPVLRAAASTYLHSVISGDQTVPDNDIIQDIVSSYETVKERVTKLDVLSLTAEQREYLGFGTFDIETEKTPNTLIPFWIYPMLPKGLPVESIEHETNVTGGDIDLDVRNGCLAWRLTIWDTPEESPTT
jgi:hypothetical protein